MSKETERQIAAMKKLGYSDAQIEEMLEDDKAVDRNEPLPWDMSKEEHKKAMKYANADEHKKSANKVESVAENGKKAPTAYNWNTEGKARKENPTKAAIIAEIAQFLRENSENACENVVITNKERQIAFTIGDNSYEFTLVQKRKPK